MDLKSLEQAVAPILAPLVKEVWLKAIHPELQKLEGEIGSAALKAVVTAIDAALEPVIEKELDSLTPTPAA